MPIDLIDLDRPVEHQTADKGAPRFRSSSAVSIPPRDWSAMPAESRPAERQLYVVAVESLNPCSAVAAAPNELPMFAVLGWVLRARSHQQGSTLSAIAAAATWTARPVIVANQLDVAKSAVALGYIKESFIGLTRATHLRLAGNDFAG